jgi:DNA mismatch endonuclease (patch repair protein)
MDRVSKQHRSWNMSQIRGRDTKPEVAVRSLIHRMGFRFRLHAKDLPGRPDILLPKHKAAVFVHGCFWHRHESCKFAYQPKSRTTFWTQKFKENIERDRNTHAALSALGWHVIVVWECELQDMKTLAERFKSELAGASVASDTE